MNNIKTWQSRITTNSSDDDILEYKQTEIRELRAALEKAEREVAELRAIADSDDGAGGEGMKLYLENRKMKAELAALEGRDHASSISNDIACTRAYRKGLHAGYGFGINDDFVGYSRSMFSK